MLDFCKLAATGQMRLVKMYQRGFPPAFGGGEENNGPSVGSLAKIAFRKRYQYSSLRNSSRQFLQTSVSRTNSFGFTACNMTSFRGRPLEG